MEVWDSDVENDIVRPIAKKAIDLYGDEVIESGKDEEVIIDGCDVRIVRNLCIEEDMHKLLFPLTKDAKYQINIEVGIGTKQKINSKRWFVGIYYKFEDDKWIDESNLELTTYES